MLAASMGNRFPTSRKNVVIELQGVLGTREPWKWKRNGPSKRRKPINFWRSVISQQNGILSHTAVKTSELV
jgi:hypothetical protein